MANTEKLFNKMLETAKKDRVLLSLLKTTAVSISDFELASELRTIELEHFPETEETKKAKEEAKLLQGCLELVGLKKVDQSLCYKISETCKKVAEMGGDFDLKTASIIVEKTIEIFGE